MVLIEISGKLINCTINNQNEYVLDDTNNKNIHIMKIIDQLDINELGITNQNISETFINCVIGKNRFDLITKYFKSINPYTIKITEGLVLKALSFANFDTFKIIFDKFCEINSNEKIIKSYKTFSGYLHQSIGFQRLDFEAKYYITPNFIKKLFYLIMLHPEQFIRMNLRCPYAGAPYLQLACLCFTDKMINLLLDLLEQQNSSLLRKYLNQKKYYIWRFKPAKSYNVTALDMLYHNNKKYRRVSKETINRMQNMGARQYSIFKLFWYKMFWPK